MGENTPTKVSLSECKILSPVVILEDISKQLNLKKNLFFSNKTSDDANKTPTKKHTNVQKNKHTTSKHKNYNGSENSDNDFMLDVETPQSVRRSTRKKKMSIKAFESMSLRTPVRSSQMKKKTISEDDSSDEFVDTKNFNCRPSTLFEEHVSGQNMFGFQTPKRKNTMIKKASEVIDSPRLVQNTPPLCRTPRSSRMSRGTPMLSNLIKTPHTVRKQIKKKLITVTKSGECSSDSNLSNFSDSDNEFELSSNSSDESDSLSKNASLSSDEENVMKFDTKIENNLKKTRNTKKIKEDIAYVLKSDDYFASQSNKKSLTSNHTLDKLKNPRLEQDQLQKLLSSMKISKKHEEAIHELVHDYKILFTKWMYCLFEGFNVLVYGLGSKRKILESFQKEMLSNYPVIVINGFFPSLIIKDVLDSILNEIIGVTDTVSNVYESVDIIKQHLCEMPDMHLFLIVHNIDGEMLRNSKSQNVFSKLANINNLHLITSIDHINAPLIWDHIKLSLFNFTWWDITTMLPYIDETSFEGSLLVQHSGALTLSSLKNIFLSLTTNARGIFNIIIKNQINRNKDSGYQGISFRDLYGSCREAFLVSSDIALRSQLTEFVDHKIIKYRRNYDGIELMYIPIENSLLQHFLDEHLSV